MPGPNQVNTQLSDRYSDAWYLIVRRDRTSTPKLLNQLVEAFVDRELEEDTDLAAALRAFTRSQKRSDAQADEDVVDSPQDS